MCFLGFGFVSGHWLKLDATPYVGTTGLLSFRRCSLLFPSTPSLLSSCRSVDSSTLFSVGNGSRDNSTALFTGAPLCHTASDYAGLFPFRGAVSIHQLCFTHSHISNRLRVSYYPGSGAAVSHSFTWKARGRVHWKSNTPHQGPGVLCNKNRFGIDRVGARSPSARRVKSAHPRAQGL